METVKVFLSQAQKNKMSSGKSFQLSDTQLRAGSGKHAVEIQMTPKNHKTLLKNVASGKGYRFSADKIEGAGFLSDIAKTVGKKVAKVAVEKGLDAIGNRTGQSGITNALKGSVDGLVDVGANKISGGKLTKGSPAMREHMARLRGMRKGKGVLVGGDVFDKLGRDIKKGFNRTFNPKLGRKIKSALTSDTAKDVYKGLAGIAINTGATFAGAPSLGRVGSQLVNSAIDGAGIHKRRKNVMIEGGTLRDGVPRVGKGFHSAQGTHYGGSFKALGGSMNSP